MAVSWLWANVRARLFRDLHGEKSDTGTVLSDTRMKASSKKARLGLFARKSGHMKFKDARPVSGSFAKSGGRVSEGSGRPSGSDSPMVSVGKAVETLTV